MATYGEKASEKVAAALHERKAGTLKSGGSGEKVTSRKQAIAIGLSEARQAGAKVPPPQKVAAKRTAPKKTITKKAATKRAATKKAGAKKVTAKKAAAKKRPAAKQPT